MDKKTKEIEEWWNNNPFTLGVATGDYEKNDLVGRIAFESMDSKYFSEIDRKFRKHSGTGAQAPDETLLKKLLPTTLSGKTVLDIATGSGLFASVFAEAGADVTAIDLTSFAVEQAKKNLALRNLKAQVVKMDAQNMSFDESSFDFVNAWGCLMHMPDTEKAIREIHRVLKPGGHILAYMYNRSSWPFWFNLIFVRGVIMLGLVRYKGNVTRLTSRYSDGAATGGNALTKFYTPEKVALMFESMGFTQVQVYPWDIGYEPNHWPMRSFPVFKYLPKKLKAWMSKRWGYGLIVQAQKPI